MTIEPSPSRHQPRRALRLLSLFAVWLLAGTAWAAAAGTDNARTAAASPDQVIDRYLAAYTAADLDALLALYADDAVFVDVSQRHQTTGREALAENLGQLVAIHKGMRVEQKRRARSGSLVTVEVVYSGTLDCAALGRPDHDDLVYSLPAVLLFEIEDGRIRNQTDYLDYRTFTESFAALQAPSP